MKTKIHLYGRLGKIFGKLHEYEISTAGEAFRALNVNFPTTFVEELKKGAYRIVRGRKVGGMPLELDHLNTFRLGAGELHIIPVVEGSRSGKGSGGALKAILGVAIIGAAIFFSGGTLAAPLAGLSGTIGGTGLSYGSVAFLGVGMALMGVGSMLTTHDKPKNASPKDDSFAFNGPTNNGKQGAALPLIYGECITGSMPISFSSDAYDIAIG